MCLPIVEVEQYTQEEEEKEEEEGGGGGGGAEAEEEEEEEEEEEVANSKFRFSAFSPLRKDAGNRTFFSFSA